jgi:hypothetical protein
MNIIKVLNDMVLTESLHENECVINLLENTIHIFEASELTAATALLHGYLEEIKNNTFSTNRYKIKCGIITALELLHLPQKVSVVSIKHKLSQPEIDADTTDIEHKLLKLLPQLKNKDGDNGNSVRDELCKKTPNHVLSIIYKLNKIYKHI